MEYKNAKRIRQEKIDFLNEERAREAEKVRVERQAAVAIAAERDRVERENYLLAIAAERDRVERDRVAREAENDRLAIEEFERVRVAREAERSRVERYHVAREAERARVESETARLETEIGQGNFRYRERTRRQR